MALAFYIRFFRQQRRVPRVRGDSSAALGAAQHLASPSPAMNFLGAELALLLERENCAEMVVSQSRTCQVNWIPVQTTSRV